MRITQVTATPVRVDDTKPKSWLSESLVANPMSIYPEYKAKRSSWGAQWGPELLVRIETDEGIEGIGAPVPGGGRIDHRGALPPPAGRARTRSTSKSSGTRCSARRFPMAARGCRSWRSARSISPSGTSSARRPGSRSASCSAARTKDPLPVYSTGNDVAFYQKLGFTGFKLAMPYGPVDGWEGIKKNIELIEKTREIVGPDGEIMLDCYMAWNVDYTLRMARARRAVPHALDRGMPAAGRLRGLRRDHGQIAASPIATGEHEYTRWGFKELIARRCCHILQPDLAWVGGITEAKKIAAMASAWGLDVIPHAGGLHPWGLHFIQSRRSIARWPSGWSIGNKGEEDPIRPLFPYLEGAPVPKNGFILPSNAPGIGVQSARRLVAGHRRYAASRRGCGAKPVTATYHPFPYAGERGAPTPSYPLPVLGGSAVNLWWVDSERTPW